MHPSLIVAHILLISQSLVASLPLQSRDWNGYICPGGYLAYAERIERLQPDQPDYDLARAVDYFAKWTNAVPGDLVNFQINDTTYHGRNTSGAMRSYVFDDEVILKEVLVNATVNDRGNGNLHHQWNSTESFIWQARNVSNYYSSFEIYPNATSGEVYVNYHINLCVVEFDAMQAAADIVNEFVDKGLAAWREQLWKYKY